MKNKMKEPRFNTVNAVMMLGERYHSVPESLYRDDRLTHRARTLWQMLKIDTSPYSGRFFPSYEQLQIWLSEQPFLEKKVSRKIVTQTIFILRLTRWITMCETERNSLGQVVGNVYIIHNEPISIQDTLLIKSDYIDFVQRQAKSKDNLVRAVAENVLAEIDKDLNIPLNNILERERHRMEGMKNSAIQINNLEAEKTPAVELLKKRFGLQDSENIMELSKNNQISHSSLKELSENKLSSIMELSKNDLSPIRELSKKSKFLDGTQQEKNANSLISDLVPLGNSYSTSTISTNSSTTNSNEISEIQKELLAFNLKPKEQKQIFELMNKLDPENTLEVIQEVKCRHAKQSLNAPVAYLISTLKKAMAGEFRPYLCKKENTQSQEERLPAHYYKIYNPEPAPTTTAEERAKILNNFKKALEKSSAD